MIASLQRAVIALLTGAGWPAYAEDAVPGSAAFPLATLRLDPPAAWDGQGSAVLTAWASPASDTAQADRMALAEKLMALVPQGGALLALDEGVAALYPAGNLEFPDDRGALGVRLRCAVTAIRKEE